MIAHLGKRQTRAVAMLETAIIAPVLLSMILVALESGLNVSTRIGLERSAEIIRENEISLLSSDASATKPIDERFRRPAFAVEAQAVIDANTLGTYKSFCAENINEMVTRRYFASLSHFAFDIAMSVPLEAKPAVTVIEISCEFRGIVATPVFGAALSGPSLSRAVILTEGM